MLELFTEMFVLKHIIVKGCALFKLEYVGTSAKKDSTLEICEDTVSYFSFFPPVFLPRACFSLCMSAQIYLKMQCKFEFCLQLSL